MPRSPPLLACGLALLLAGCEASARREVVLDLERRPVHPLEPSPASAGPLRFAVAHRESRADGDGNLEELAQLMARRLRTPVRLVRGGTAREVTDLLAGGQVDAALVSGGGLVDLRRRAPGTVEVLAVPVVDGETTYRALVVVPEASDARGLADLVGRRFAYTEELSLSGRLWAVERLRELGRDPDHFFGQVTYTFDHDQSIEDVATGRVDGAAVNSRVYERDLARSPGLAGRVRVVERSPPFGMRPLVASARLPAAERARLADVFITLDQDAEGREALRRLGLDRFVPPLPGLYEPAGRLTWRRP